MFESKRQYKEKPKKINTGLVCIPQNWQFDWEPVDKLWDFGSHYFQTNPNTGQKWGLNSWLQESNQQKIAEKYSAHPTCSMKIHETPWILRSFHQSSMRFQMAKKVVQCFDQATPGRCGRPPGVGCLGDSLTGRMFMGF